MTYNSTVLADSPTLYFPFTGSSYASTGSRTGVTTTAASTTFTTGFSDVAANFSTGTSGYIEYSVNSNDVFNTNIWTLELWFKKANTTDALAYRELFNNYDSNNQVAIYGDDSTGKVALWVNLGTATRTKINGPVINDTNWHHVVATNNAGTLTFYVDGVSQGTASGILAGTFVTSTPMWIGAYGTATSNENWHGLIDEIAIYKGTALSATKVQTHYTASGVGAVTYPPAATMSMTSVVPTFIGNTTDVLVTPPAATLSLTSVVPTVARGEYGFVETTDTDNGTYFGVGQSGPGNAYDVAKFAPTLPGAGYTVASATLYFQVYQYTVTTAQTMYLGNVVTYNSGAAFSGTPISYTANYPMYSNQWYAVDVTSIVGGWLSGGINNGIGISRGSSADAGVFRLIGHENASRSLRLGVTYSPPPPNVTTTPPVMTASLATAAPTATVSSNVSNPAPAMTLSMVTTVVGLYTDSNISASAPVLGLSVDTLTPVVITPDATPTTTPISLGLSVVTPNVVVPIVSLAPPMTLSLGTVPATVNLTTSVLKVAPVMGMSLSAVGIYDAAHDRYFNKLTGEIQPLDLWYKLDETAGSTAVDFAGGNQNGAYHGTLAPITDGPQLRKGVHFDGTSSYLAMGAYGSSSQNSSDFLTTDALTVEFSIRTTQTDGVVFIGNGWVQHAQSANGPEANGNELRLEGGMLVVVNPAGKKVKVRKNIADGQWHHIVFAIPQAQDGGGTMLDPSQPSYVMVDGDHALVRYGTFLGDTTGYGGQWFPYTVMARANGTGFTQGDLSNFIVRVNRYISVRQAQSIYYEWSDANIMLPTPVAASLTTVAPKVKGSVKKMLALYGLPFTREYVPPAVGGAGHSMYDYMDVLSGMVIKNLGGSTNLQNVQGSSVGLQSWAAPQSFMLDDYMVVPVSIFGNLDNSPYDALSSPGALNSDSSVSSNGIYVYDETGHPRFINLQNDLSSDVTEEYDVITVLNYPWEKQNDIYGGPENYVIPYHGYGNMTNDQWEQARDDFRDSLLEAVYDGCNMWIGDYYMAQHLGFIQGYDIHSFDRWGGLAMPTNTAGITGSVPNYTRADQNGGVRQTDVSSGGGAFEYNLGAETVDNQHLPIGAKSTLVGSNAGDYFSYPQANFYRRVTALVPGLTDLPGNDYGPWVEGWNVDDFLPNGNFIAYDILRRPNGLQLGDNLTMQNLWMGSKFYGETSGTSSLSKPTARVAITSAHPDGICGTVVSREQEFYYGPFGAKVENPYKDNALTIAAEVGTIVNGRPIGGRVFIELMGTDWGLGYIPEDVNKMRWHGSSSAEMGGQYSTWDYDSRRELELKNALTIQTLKMSDKQGAFTVATKTIYFFSYSNEVVTYNLHLPMAYRGLKWLQEAPTLAVGDARGYASAIQLTLTEPTATVSQTASPASQVNGAMRLDLEVRQPANYRDGNIEERVLPMGMFLEVRGLGRTVTAPPMSLTLTTPNPKLKVAADTVTVYLDEGRNITLFLKEDN